VELFEAFGPPWMGSEVRDSAFERLGMKPLPPKGRYFRERPDSSARSGSAERAEPKGPWRAPENPALSAWLQENAEPLATVVDEGRRYAMLDLVSHFSRRPADIWDILKTLVPIGDPSGWREKVEEFILSTPPGWLAAGASEFFRLHPTRPFRRYVVGGAARSGRAGQSEPLKRREELSEALVKKIRSRKAVIGVVGLGYVGLPLVHEFVGAGASVLGFDVDPGKVKALKASRSYIEHIPSKMIAGMVRSGRFDPTDDFSRLDEPDCILICVPTPLTKMREPDMRYVVNTARAITQRLRKGQLVVLESTTYPGTTEEVLLPILAETGLKVGRDFYLAYSPEREDPGRKDHTTRTIPKVVGGHDPASLRAAVACYSLAVNEVVPVSSCAAAEASKILENTYRCVNIALVNELKMLFDRMGIDVWEVIRAASTKPFGFQPFYPGPGLGGHCIPIDPFYLSWKAREYDMPTRFIQLAGEVNVSMPEWVVQRLADALNRRRKPLKGSKILVLGLAYKKDVDDIRESPSIELIELLRQREAKVDYNDPHVRRTHKQREHDLKMTSRKLSAAMLGRYDAVLIATDHSAYDYQFIVDNARLVVDTRNATESVKRGRSKIVRA